MKIKIEFPDGSVKEFDKGISGYDIAKSIGERLAMAALAVEINGEVKDLTAYIEKDSKIKILTFKDKEGKDVYWHSASHLMTQAILRIYPDQNIGLGVGMPVDDGFYQDYDIKDLHPEDLIKIEKEMQKIVEEKLKITHKEVSKKDALKFYEKDPYKIELTHAVPGQKVSMYCQGEFENLCKGPHVPNTSYIKAFKLTQIAGAYWRGDSKNKMLTRIYGIAFPDKKELNLYLERLEEAKKRDHKKVGKQLGLFTFSDIVGPGLPLLMPKGQVMRHEMENFLYEIKEKYGHKFVWTPHLAKSDLYIKSKHWQKYDAMMPPIKMDDGEYTLKPMNCPHHFQIYLAEPKSYRDLPLRLAENATVYRYEKSGVINGLFRVRAITQDDSHWFVPHELLNVEIDRAIDLMQNIYKTFGLDKYYARISVRDKVDKSKYLGDDKAWESSEKELVNAVEKRKIKYEIGEGEAAFYGPKIDLMAEDSLGREWQLMTIQLDFNQPNNFDLVFTNKEGNDEKVAVLHIAILGSIERFLAILIEHFAAKFPLWLSPIQVRVMTVSQKFGEHGQKIVDAFSKEGIRAELDNRAESIPKKVREAQLDKIPLMITIGEKEAENNTLAIRTLDGQVKFAVKTDEFIKKVKENIKRRELKFVV
ncbi:MAG: threonine--tRNA ligase [archaeon]